MVLGARVEKSGQERPRPNGKMLLLASKQSEFYDIGVGNPTEVFKREISSFVGS